MDNICGLKKAALAATALYAQYIKCNIKILKPSRELVKEEKTPGPLERIDRAAFRALYFGTRSRVLSAIMPVFSIIANRGALHILCGAFMILAGIHIQDGGRLTNAGVALLASAAVAGVLAEFTIKLVWKRKRPFQVMEDVRALVPAKRLSNRPSFPSGHSAGYMAAATAVSIYYPVAAWALIPIGLMGAYSRIYNGVHYPSDVIVGISIGVGSAFLTVALMPAHLPFF